MWDVLRRYPVAIVVALALVAAGAVLWVGRLGPQLAGAAAQQELYDRFQPYPGAERVSRQTYEHRADGNRTGSYGVQLVYRLPADATAARVLEHYRRQIPAGWSEASDQTCAESLARRPAPPDAAPSAASAGSAPSDPDPAAFVLQRRASHLTVLAADADPAAGRIHGLTLALSRTPSGKYVTFDAPTYSCGAPEPDRVAIDFDAP